MTRDPDSATGHGPESWPRPGPAAAPGWYPDTVSDSEAFRWWDGARWTQAVSESLWEPEPRHAPPYLPPSSAVSSTPPAPTEFELEGEPPGKKSLLIGMGVAAVVVSGALGLLTLMYSGDNTAADDSSSRSDASSHSAGRDAGRKGSNQDEGAEQSPGSEQDGESGEEQQPPPVEGWPTFETLGKDWWTGDESVAPHAKVRHFTTEQNYSGDDDWIATVLTGEIPEKVEPDDELARTANRVADWYAKVPFGPDREPNYKRVDGGPTIVADRPAYQLTVRMPYRLKGLKATSDDVEIVVVDLGPDRRPGMYLAAVPNTDPKLWKVCDEAKKSLSLDG